MGRLIPELVAHVARAVPPSIRRSGPARAMATRMFARAPARQVVPVADGPLKGVHCELHLATEKSYWMGVHEEVVQRALVENAPHAALAFDVGAQIGFFSLLLARLGCSPVVALEPFPEHAERIRNHAELNNLNIVTVEAAATATPGRQVLELGPTTGTHRLVGVKGPGWRAPGPGSYIEVAGVTLDDLAKEFGIPKLIKIDVEGAEADVLDGAEHLLAERPTIVCEMHGRQQLEQIKALLASFDYDVSMLSDNHILAIGATHRN